MECAPINDEALYIVVANPLKVHRMCRPVHCIERTFAESNEPAMRCSVRLTGGINRHQCEMREKSFGEILAHNVDIQRLLDRADFATIERESDAAGAGYNGTIHIVGGCAGLRFGVKGWKWSVGEELVMPPWKFGLRWRALLQDYYCKDFGILPTMLVVQRTGKTHKSLYPIGNMPEDGSKPITQSRRGLSSLQKTVKAKKDALLERVYQKEKITLEEEHWLDHSQANDELEEASDFKRGLARLDCTKQRLVDTLKQLIDGGKEDSEQNKKVLKVKKSACSDACLRSILTCFREERESTEETASHNKKGKNKTKPKAPEKPENATLSQRIEILNWHHKNGKIQSKTARHWEIYPHLNIKQPHLCGDPFAWHLRGQTEGYGLLGLRLYTYIIKIDAGGKTLKTCSQKPPERLSMGHQTPELSTHLWGLVVNTKTSTSGLEWDAQVPQIPQLHSTSTSRQEKSSSREWPYNMVLEKVVAKEMKGIDIVLNADTSKRIDSHAAFAGDTRD
ncbi:hypothetical protein C8R44DRAFT_728629 [Mycena epipterygia]|nr:hypothetical protein C8R44DRAFT_728629 [Mycena epipterygia]